MAAAFRAWALFVLGVIVGMMVQNSFLSVAFTASSNTLAQRDTAAAAFTASISASPATTASSPPVSDVVAKDFDVTQRNAAAMPPTTSQVVASWRRLAEAVSRSRCPHRGLENASLNLPTTLYPSLARGNAMDDDPDCTCRERLSADKPCKAAESNNWRIAAWNHVVEAFPEPPMAKRTWALPHCGQKLAVVLLERDNVASLRAALHNVAHVYGGTNTALYVFHSTANDGLIRNVTGTWHGVQYRRVLDDVDTIPKYSRLLASYAFYDQFPQQFVLVTQSDVLVRTRVPELYFRYSYVGAPWSWVRDGVGNGGFSLRRVESMKRLLAKFGDLADETNEDVFLSFRLDDWEVPGGPCARAFASESFWCGTSVGAHKLQFTPPDPCRLWSYVCSVEGFGESNCAALRRVLQLAS